MLALAVLLGGWFWWHAGSKPQARPTPPAGVRVRTAPVTRGDLDVYLDALGTVTPVNTVTVVSRVAGEITEVHFKEGQTVRRGDLLAVIDPRPYTALVLQGRGQLARDRAALKNARLDLTRYQNSYKEHAIPEQQLATQQAAVEQNEGTVELDQGALDAAQINVDYTRIVSPIDGRVGLRNIDPGNVVSANGTTGLCVVTQIEPITVIFTIAEDAIDEVFAQMKTGTAMQVLALDRAKQHTLATGTLLTVDNQVNTTTGTVRARATFANAHNELFPNQFVNARLRVRTLRGANLLPAAALQRNGDQSFVYRVKPDSTVETRDVTILATEGENSAVTGVDPGDSLVIDGFDKLQNGSKVVLPSTSSKPATPHPAVTAG